MEILKFTGQDQWINIYGVTLPNYNLTKQGTKYILEKESLLPQQTLSTSRLVKTDVKEASELEIRRQFCTEIKAISLKYSEGVVSNDNTFP